VVGHTSLASITDLGSPAPRPIFTFAPKTARLRQWENLSLRIFQRMSLPVK
jgi:hypothetical protein